MPVENHKLEITKNTEKSGGWLAEHTKFIGDGSSGTTRVASAWTTAAAAKKWCATRIGRSRLTWKTDGSAKPTHFAATQSMRVTSNGDS